MQGLGVQLPEPCTPEVGISRVLRVWDSEPLLVDIYIYIYVIIQDISGWLSNLGSLFGHPK